MNFIKNTVYFWKSILITSIILYLSFAPPSTFKGIPSFDYEDKLVHFLMYLSLCFMLIYDLQKIYNKIKVDLFIFILLCLVFPVLLGGAIEILQPMYFTRDSSWFDWLADIIGVIIGFMIMFGFKKTPPTLFKSKK
jgi:VanZ family protein